MEEKMNLNIHAGMRVLYKKNNSNWMIGELGYGNACINKNGLYLPVFDQSEFKKIHSMEWDWDEAEQVLTNINYIFFDAIKLEDWIKDYHQYFMTKEEYIKFIESEEFDKRTENAYVSDGEYRYYPVSKYNKAWIEKQPFDYVVREE